jgi:hypothetical protein
MKKFDQRGTGIIEVLLILVIVGMVGFMGWYVWHSRQSTEATLKKAATQSSATAPKAKTSTSASGKTDYLVITEWGVKLPLETAIKDAYYYRNTQDPNLKNYVYLGTHSLTAQSAACAPEHISLGVIGRQTEAEHATNAAQGSAADAPVYSLKVGNYYYGYTHPQAACGDTDTINDIMTADMARFKIAVDNLVAN